jgi:hypothetical protein
MQLHLQPANASHYIKLHCIIVDDAGQGKRPATPPSPAGMCRVQAERASGMELSTACADGLVLKYLPACWLQSTAAQQWLRLLRANLPNYHTGDQHKCELGDRRVGSSSLRLARLLAVHSAPKRRTGHHCKAYVCAQSHQQHALVKPQCDHT